MQPNPLISIITVVRNDKCGLDKTIQSVSLLCNENVQYIVVDGGSTDGTLDIIAAHLDIIDRWTSEPDDGIYDAMNKGASFATGEWIWFMNAGDQIHDSHVIQRIREQINSCADVILGGAKTTLKDDYQIRECYKPPKDLRYLWQEMPTCHQSVLIRTRLQQQFTFDTTFKWCADFDLLVRFYKNGHAFASVDTAL